MTATPPPSQPTVVWENPEITEGPAPGIEYAPYGGRLVAYLLDTLILTFVAGFFFVIAFALLGSGATMVDNRITAIEPGATTGFVVFLLIGTIIAVLYFPFFWARGGQTPGMRPFDLRVVRDADGSRIGWGTAFLRLIGLWVAAAVFYIGYIWIFVDKRRRGWQDLIAGTVVIKQP
jgi:uncharacterized RDD family membrane protein YckC